MHSVGIHQAGNTEIRARFSRMFFFFFFKYSDQFSFWSHSQFKKDGTHTWLLALILNLQHKPGEDHSPQLFLSSRFIGVRFQPQQCCFREISQPRDKRYRGRPRSAVPRWLQFFLNKIRRAFYFMLFYYKSWNLGITILHLNRPLNR